MLRRAMSNLYSCTCIFFCSIDADGGFERLLTLTLSMQLSSRAQHRFQEQDSGQATRHTPNAG